MGCERGSAGSGVRPCKRKRRLATGDGDEQAIVHCLLPYPNSWRIFVKMSRGPGRSCSEKRSSATGMKRRVGQAIVGSPIPVEQPSRCG